MNIPKKVVDITDIELTPGKPDVCLGNGKHDFECCCDECDYYLLCFPEFDPKNRKGNTANIPAQTDLESIINSKNTWLSHLISKRFL